MERAHFHDAQSIDVAPYNRMYDVHGHKAEHRTSAPFVVKPLTGPLPALPLLGSLGCPAPAFWAASSASCSFSSALMSAVGESMAAMTKCRL